MPNPRERSIVCTAGWAAVLATWLVVLPVRVAGQGPRPSQHGTVSQTVDSTVITVVYDRPVAKGRELFGDDGVVLTGALWTPGANRATTLEVSRDVLVEGQAVAAGRYSVWMIPGEADWTLILNRVWDTSHTIYPGKDEDALRTVIHAERGAHMEVLAFYFPIVNPYDAVLRLHWGETVVPVRIEEAEHAGG